ncbi:MAG: PIG-L family deacetylase [Oscillospiraceae bacterium]|nr:PIG-L family deacetylase [Oscillospiraceae bacterium]
MKIISLLQRAFVSFIYAMLVAIPFDLVCFYFDRPYSFYVFLLIIVAGFLFFFFCSVVRKKFWIAALILLTVCLATTVSMYVFYLKGDYRLNDDSKASLFSDKKVMVLLPHQDDEIIVAGGVIEEYIKYGSDVSLAYAISTGTNRLHEVLNVAADMGIEEENVFFLGYGDYLYDIDAKKHFYNLPDDHVLSDYSGRNSTFGLDDHPAYNQGNLSTKANLRSDLISLLLEEKPEIIYCVSVEFHADHSAVALLLDEAMAEILRLEPDYRPVLMMSSCYTTSHYMVNDFHAENLRSSQDAHGHAYFAEVYDWNSRVRLPVSPEGLSRSIFGCKTFQHTRMHGSQPMHRSAESIVNGDKVFWLRDTNSLCYLAQMETSSGNAALLNDFKLFDNNDLVTDFKALSANTWVPDKGDAEKCVSVTFANSSNIQRICLYDDPSRDNNILNAIISFDDGSSLKTGPLNTFGCTTIEVDKKDVKSFSVKILESEGEGAGLSEIEAYSQQVDYGFDFIKLQNMQGDFIYDCYIDESCTESFEVYAPGIDSEFCVSVDNPKCSASIDNGIVTVSCPKNELCELVVTSEDGVYSDKAIISNPGKFMRKIGPSIESKLRYFRCSNFINSNTNLLKYTILYRLEMLF